MSKNNDFFIDVSSHCNHLDPEIIRDVYYAIIRTILDRCRTWGGVKLPDFGQFVFFTQKSKGMIDVNTKEYRIIPTRTKIKFIVGYKLDEYLKGFDEKVFK
jgi:nucleoid DNA-binding protein